jgi:UDP-N-acetylmuramate--alanine ligase
VLTRFRGVGRRFELRGEAGGVAVYDDYAHHPTELAAAIAAAREQGAARVVVLFQPHLYSRTRHLAAEFGLALATADVACVSDVYRAREQPVAGVSGMLVVDAVADVRPGMPLGWAPTVDEGAELVAAWARPGDVVLTLGAGDVDRAADRILALLDSGRAV